MKIFAYIKFFYGFLAIGISIIVTIVLFFRVLPGLKGVKASASMMIHALFLKIKVEGEEEDENVQMFLLNHESDIDIPVLEYITKKELAWVAKQELFDLPFFGQLLKYPKNIAVQRESKTSLIKLLRDAKDRLDSGRVIAIFPEGTRSVNKKMLPFKSGAKMVADKYKLRVQPIVLINTSSYYSVKLKTYNPGCIKVVRLKSFTADKSDPDWLKRCHDEMQAIYNKELEYITNNKEVC